MQMKTKKKSAYGYVRVSTTGQVDEGVSLEAQRDRIADYCANRGFDLVDVIEDAGISGKNIKDRPGLQAALSKLKRGQVLVTFSWSRLARSTIDLLNIEAELKRRGVEIASVTDQHMDTTSASGAMHFQMLATFGEFERRTIGERTRAAMQHLKRQGRFTGGESPLGWRVEGDLLVPIVEEQIILHFIHNLRVRGRSFRQILRELDLRGIRNRKGHPLALAQVQRILRRPPIQPFPFADLGLQPPVGDQQPEQVAISMADFIWVVEGDYDTPNVPAFLDRSTGEVFLLGDVQDEERAVALMHGVRRDPFRYLLLPCATKAEFSRVIRLVLARASARVEANTTGHRASMDLGREHRIFIRERAEAFLQREAIPYRWV